MSYIIDRRLNGKNKSTVNRQRVLERYRRHVREAVNEAVGRRSITDMEQGERISIPEKDLSEPRFHHGSGGRRNVVHPGHREFPAGARGQEPPGGEGGAGGEGGGEKGDEACHGVSFQRLGGNRGVFRAGPERGARRIGAEEPVVSGCDDLSLGR